MSGGEGGRRGGGDTGGGVGSDFHKSKKLLNERIKSITSMQELCDLIHASSTEFNHVNVATAFRQVLQMPRDGVSQDSVAKALQTLENRALHTMKTFDSQAFANTLHIMAKKSHKPSETLMLTLQGRSEAMSEEFNSQGVSNTLWTYATMRRKPGNS